MTRRSRGADSIITLLLACASMAFACNTSSKAPPPDSPAVATANFTHFAPAFAGIHAKLRWSRGLFPINSDDQKFKEGKKDEYGPLAGIAPSDTLESFRNPADFDTPVHKGRLVAAITVGAGLTESYTLLRLTEGDNCVYLQHNANDTWTGYVTPMGGAGAECPNDHATTDRNLEVIRAIDDDYADPLDVPPVARFHEGDFQGDKGRPLFGVKCGDGAWCYFLPAGMKVTPAFHKKPHLSKQWNVPGWGDVQNLAVADFGQTATYKKDLVASIVPKENLHRLRKDFEFKDMWRWVATVQFEKSPAGTPYASKWHFDKDDNRIELMWSGDTAWLAQVRVKSGTGAEATFPLGRVNQTPHPGVTATARFRWKENDETLWVRCDEGCCEIGDGFQLLNPHQTPATRNPTNAPRRRP